MRLEHDGDLTLSGDDVRLADRGLDLCRVMGVVIEQATRTNLAARLEATGRARELAQAVGNRLGFEPTLNTGHPRGSRIEHIVFAGHSQRQRRAALPPRQGRAGPVSLDAYVGNHNIGCRSERSARPYVTTRSPSAAGRVRQTTRTLILRARHQTGHREPNGERTRRRSPRTPRANGSDPGDRAPRS